MEINNQKGFSAGVILMLMGALLTIGAFELNNTIHDLEKVENRIEAVEIDFQQWKERVLPVDTAQSKSIAETDRFQELLWNRMFPQEPYPKMRTPPPAVEP